MGRLILRGVGLAIGLALWPLALPVAVLVGLVRGVQAAAGSQGADTGCCGDVPPSPGYPLADEPVFTPQLGDAKARALAVVAEINREHLERSLNAD